MISGNDSHSSEALKFFRQKEHRKDLTVDNQIRIEKSPGKLVISDQDLGEVNQNPTPAKRKRNYVKKKITSFTEEMDQRLVQLVS